ncbi:MAG: 5'/3'-nucleotidase SurE [Oscillospiraceae bacterium]|nr:5'/3'-nucleotidase SurE [Oscillospiraceae bacterium]
MNILVVNDDGIFAPGIEKLARAAAKFGNVTVVAPAKQCSAMSMRITLFADMELKEYDFPVEGVKAYSLDGTPADCVKAALYHLLPEKPDFVFSGINAGYNTGRDVLYSGTVNAALEAVLDGVPAVAFSNENSFGSQEVCDHYLEDIMREVMALPAEPYTIWNVNFPCCALSEVKGIRRGVTLADVQLFTGQFLKKTDESGKEYLCQVGTVLGLDKAPEGTDVHAVLSGYIAIGRVTAAVNKA